VAGGPPADALRSDTIRNHMQMIINKHFAFESYRLRGCEAARLRRWNRMIHRWGAVGFLCPSEWITGVQEYRKKQERREVRLEAKRISPSTLHCLVDRVVTDRTGRIRRATRRPIVSRKIVFRALRRMALRKATKPAGCMAMRLARCIARPRGDELTWKPPGTFFRRGHAHHEIHPADLPSYLIIGRCPRNLPGPGMV
jgi:hypothetical protein